MGAASSIFGQTPPNLYALEQLIARYEALKPQRLTTPQLYAELEKELSSITTAPRLTRPASSKESEAVDSPDIAGKEAPTDSSMNVLVVDDSRISCRLAKRVLSTLHFDATTVESGEQALSTLNERPDYFDLVLLDIVMPQMDGMQVLRNIKGSPALNHIPVAMLSGLEDQNLAEICFQVGAVEVLLKPLKANAVVKVVRQHCRRKNMEMPPPNPPKIGDVTVGDQPRSFTFAASDFSSVTVPAAGCGKKVLLIFFPAAFVVSRSVDSNQLLVRANRHFLALKSANTEVVGISRELPYTLSALKTKLDLQFPLLCDPTLTASSYYVGTMDYGDFIIESFGVHMSGLTGYRASNAGLVLLDESNKVIYKWVPTAAEVQQEAVVIAEFQKLFQLLKFSDFDIQQPRSTSSSMTAAGDRMISTMPSSPSSSSFIDTATAAAARQGIISTPAGGRPTIRNAGRASVLVVDDNSISSKLAVRKLSSMGHDAMHAENGQFAIELLQRFPNDFDLVLLDIVMPVMDGVEVLSTIKNDARLKNVPVVMLSGLEDETLAEVCLSTGAMDVLFKPLDMNKVQQLLERVHTTSSA